MKCVEKTISVLVVLAMAIFMISGCDSAPDETVSSGATSEELNLYIIGSEICDKSGTKVENGCSIDEKGNIVDDQGRVLIAAGRTEAFSYVKSIYYEKEQLLQEIKGTLLGDGDDSSHIAGKIVTEPKSFRFRFTVEPKNAVNTELTLESCDPGALFFPYDKNSACVKEKDVPGDNILPKISTQPNSNNQVEITATAVLDGTVEILVRNVFGEIVNSITFTVRPVIDDSNPGDSSLQASTQAETHEHVFYSRTVEPTVYAQGYTLYTCEKCGFAYRDNYTDKLSHAHDYDSRVIPPTYTAKGYTLHICKTCGYTIRDSELPSLICNHENMKETTVSPTCTEEGYTLHECLNCRIYSYKDSYTEKTGHKWDNGIIAKRESCTEEGVRTLTCSICGDTKNERISKSEHSYRSEIVPPTYTEEGYTRHYCIFCGNEKNRTDYTPIVPHTHSYFETVKNATCTESGYVTHTCSLCGDSYTDSKTDAYGHYYEEQIIREPNCTEEGISSFTCSRCGHRYTYNAPALGHAYFSTTVEATSETEGYTEHRCSRCGDVFRDTYTARLPVQTKADLSSVAAAGNSWLIRNGYSVGGTGGNCSYQFAMSKSDSQAALEANMCTVAEVNVRSAMSVISSDPTVTGAEFYCSAYESGESIILSCSYSFIANPDAGWNDM